MAEPRPLGATRLVDGLVALGADLLGGDAGKRRRDIQAGFASVHALEEGEGQVLAEDRLQVGEQLDVAERAGARSRPSAARGWGGAVGQAEDLLQARQDGGRSGTDDRAERGVQAKVLGAAVQDHSEGLCDR
jgi:hypothetical protein